MRGTGRKRKLDSGGEVGPSAQRTREDIMGCDFTSILPQTQNIVSDILIGESQKKTDKKNRGVHYIVAIATTNVRRLRH